jgi:hypothetical protein
MSHDLEGEIEKIKVNMGSEKKKSLKWQLMQI